MRDQLGPVQGKDPVSPIEAQDEAILDLHVHGSYMSVCQGQRRQSSLAPIPVQWEQCQSNVSVVPVQDLTVSEEFVSPTPVFLQNVRSAEAVSEEIVSAVSTSESVTLDVRLLPCRSRFFK